MLAVTEDGLGSDQERDPSKISSLSPARVHLPGSLSVIQVACGLHHSGEREFFAPPGTLVPLHQSIVSDYVLFIYRGREQARA